MPSLRAMCIIGCGAYICSCEVGMRLGMEDGVVSRGGRVR